MAVVIRRLLGWRRESVGAGADNREASGTVETVAADSGDVIPAPTTPRPAGDVIAAAVIAAAVHRMLADMKAWG